MSADRRDEWCVITNGCFQTTDFTVYRLRFLLGNRGCLSPFCLLKFKTVPRSIRTNMRQLYKSADVKEKLLTSSMVISFFPMFSFYDVTSSLL